MINNSIKEYTSKLVQEETMKLDRERTREDFMGLYGDITEELAKQDMNFGRLLYEYTELMDQEQQFFSPESAYEAGMCAQKAEFVPMLMQYIIAIYLDPANCALLQKRDTLFYKLCELLGDASGLMTEFNDLYRECNGIIGRNIDRFFQMGFEQSYGKTVNVLQG